MSDLTYKKGPVAEAITDTSVTVYLTDFRVTHQKSSSNPVGGPEQKSTSLSSTWPFSAVVTTHNAVDQ